MAEASHQLRTTVAMTPDQVRRLASAQVRKQLRRETEQRLKATHRDSGATAP
jgi:uncharacterized protein (DUF885 family)